MKKLFFILLFNVICFGAKAETKTYSLDEYTSKRIMTNTRTVHDLNTKEEISLIKDSTYEFSQLEIYDVYHDYSSYDSYGEEKKNIKERRFSVDGHAISEEEYKIISAISAPVVDLKEIEENKIKEKKKRKDEQEMMQQDIQELKESQKTTNWSLWGILGGLLLFL